MEDKKSPVIVICGPTASGKTGLALQLAKELKTANILSVDSRQVYKDLDIITGKDIPQDIPVGVKVYGHDLFNSNERANLADFIRYAQKVIVDSIESKIPLIIVGGTGLYLKAITHPLSDTSIPPDPKLREELESRSVKELQEILQRENPKKLKSLNHSDFMNPRRLIRYIEIHRAGKKASGSNNPVKNVSFKWIGLLPGKKQIKESINRRVIERINSGAVNEVKQLQKNFPDKKLTIYSSLGVAQIIKFLDGNLSEKQLVGEWTNAEVDYARRQIVWFKKQPNIVWYDKSTDRESFVSQLKNIFKKNA